MPNYHLSEAAKEDLIRIAQYGNEYFGVTQSDHYRDQLKRRFLIIAERPLFFPAVDHIYKVFHNYNYLNKAHSNLDL